MKKLTTYQLNKSVKMGTKTVDLAIGTLKYNGTRHNLAEARTHDGSLAELASIANNATVCDAFVVLTNMFELPFISSFADWLLEDTTRNHGLPFDAVLAPYDVDNADGFVDVKKPKETMSDNVVVRVTRHYYKRTNRGTLRYVGLTFDMVTFGKHETHTVRCDKFGHVSPRDMSLISMWRLIESALSECAHESASAVQSVEHKRTTVTYRLAPVATGVATGIA